MPVVLAIWVVTHVLKITDILACEFVLCFDSHVAMVMVIVHSLPSGQPWTAMPSVL